VKRKSENRARVCKTGVLHQTEQTNVFSTADKNFHVPVHL